MTEIRRQRRAFWMSQSAPVTWLALLIFLLLTSTVWGMEIGEFDLSVRSTTQYHYSWSDDPRSGTAAEDNSDQDFGQHLGIDADWREKGLTFSIMGRYLKDLDGTPEGSIFQDYTDTNSHRQDFKTYYAYLEKQDFLTRGLDVRAGRQYTYGAETVHFDGLLCSYHQPDWAGLQVELFGGKLVQHYTDLARNEVGGYNLTVHPTSNLAMTLDGVFSDNNSTESGIYWQPTHKVQANTRLALINSHPRFLDVATQVLIPSTKTLINIGVYHRYDVDLDSDYLFDYTYTFENALSTKLSSLYLLQEKAYTNYDFRVSQPIPQFPGLTLYARYTKRVIGSHDENLYNTDFDRITAGFNLEDGMTLKGFSLDAGYSYWKENRSVFYEGKSSSFYADVHQRLNKFEIGAGYYHKTEYVNSRIENEAATRYQASLKYHFAEKIWLEALYQYDKDDFFKEEFGIDSINAITLTLFQRF